MDKDNKEISAELLKLIKEADSEHDKGVLLILYQMSDILDSQRKLLLKLHQEVKLTSRELEEHIKQELEAANACRSRLNVWYKILAIVNTVALPIGLFFLTEHISHGKDIEFLKGQITTINISKQEEN